MNLQTVKKDYRTAPEVVRVADHDYVALNKSGGLPILVVSYGQDLQRTRTDKQEAMVATLLSQRSILPEVCCCPQAAVRSASVAGAVSTSTLETPSKERTFSEGFICDGFK